MASPYRGATPVADTEPPPDFRAKTPSGRDVFFALAMLTAVPVSATFVAAPAACAIIGAVGLVLSGVAARCADRRMKKYATNEVDGPTGDA